MAANDELEDAGDLSSDPFLASACPDIPGEVEMHEDDPDEFIVWVTDDRAIVFVSPGHEQDSRWGRFIAVLSARELRSLLLGLDPVARAVIEAKRLTAALVELHPADREMFNRGFKTISEEGGWIQANFRDQGRFTRLMRIRPANGVALLAGGAMTLAAVAAQAQAAAIARSLEAIGQRMDDLKEHLNDDQIGAVESVVEQVEALVTLLRTHGKRGVTKADIAVVRNALGDANHRCRQHLKRAVKNLESVTQPSTREAQKMLSQHVVDDVTLYLNLLERLHVAGVQFGLAQVAYDCHRKRPEVAKTRAEQVRKSADAHRQELEGVCRRLARLDVAMRAQSRPSMGRAAKEIATSAGQGAFIGACGALAVAAAGEATRGGDLERVRSDEARPNVGVTAAFGGAAGFAGGVALGAKNVILDVRAKKPLEERLTQLAAATSHTLETADETRPALEWLQVVAEQFAEPAG